MVYLLLVSKTFELQMGMGEDAVFFPILEGWDAGLALSSARG